MDEKEVKNRVQRAIRLMRASWYPPSNPGLLQRQVSSRRQRPFRLPLWISEAALPIQNDKALRKIFLQSVHQIDDSAPAFSLQNASEVVVEWNGYRRSNNVPLETIHGSAKEHFQSLKQDTRNDLTILFIHGGGFVSGGPSTNRIVPLALSKLTGARVCQIDYRLAPQNPFPAALYDVLLTYLSLISPPEGALHSPVPADKIVLAGESSGGNLCLAFLQLLLQLRRSGIKGLPFNDKDVPLGLPSGIGILSGYCDQSDSMPSRVGTKRVDYSGERIFYTMPSFPPDEIWPTQPPRYSAYCEGVALCHPLISPTNAKDWSGAPPMWFACGEESVLDSNKAIARRAARQGISVKWEEHTGMPHIFPLLPGLEDTPQAGFCLNSWAQFLESCSKGRMPSTQAVIIGVDGKAKNGVAVPNLLPEVPEGEVEKLMRASMLRLEGSFRKRQRRTSKI